ncbi:MAG: MBL fold metallo-hydrolase [Candidatus Aenigmatarchaeota archaeon]
MVNFKWFGQACFEISNGKTVVTDPHDGKSVGLEAPETKADIITVSHDHYDHASGKSLVSKPDSIVAEGMEKGRAEEIDLGRFQSYHDKVEGNARGENTIFKFVVDGFRICHLGDLGHKLEKEEIENLKPIDILLVPVGGKFTIDGKEAAELSKKLDPGVVIPMHYEVEGLEVPISGPQAFLENMEGSHEVVENKVLELRELPDKKTVYVLECQA